MRSETTGTASLTDFWTEKYLREYIPHGGSKIKFVSGRPGSGKTWFLRQMREAALREGYLTVDFSARDVRLDDFKELYAEILKQCDLLHCLKGCADSIVRSMGYQPEEIPEGMTFMDYLSAHGEADAITRREIRTQIKEFFLSDPVLDNNFALACSMLTGGIIGHPVLEQANRDLLLAWLEGDREVKLSAVRSLGLSPSKITRYNARHMLRSLAEVVQLAGYPGIFAAIDDLEVILNRTDGSEIKYTKIRREDTYESIRQMVDDIDNMNGIMFVFAFDRALIDDEKYGLKSYQALWMRIQNEVQSPRFNRFADIVDLDRMEAQEYTRQTVIAISGVMAQQEMEKSRRCMILTEDEAQEILDQAKTGAVGIPGLIRSAMVRGGDFTAEDAIEGRDRNV